MGDLLEFDSRIKKKQATQLTLTPEVYNLTTISFSSIHINQMIFLSPHRSVPSTRPPYTLCVRSVVFRYTYFHRHSKVKLASLRFLGFFSHSWKLSPSPPLSRLRFARLMLIFFCCIIFFGAHWNEILVIVLYICSHS